MLKLLADVRTGDTQVDYGVLQDVVYRPTETPPYYVLRLGYADFRYEELDPVSGLPTLVDMDTLLPNVVPGTG